ncbi:starch synthase [Thioclava sp. L04-15]|uniref:glycogen synthase GlgA n=1 Tax=Thioclava sp. L04-15 TaxID=1915318 RepID=UPI000996B48A|nr:glycogen synthase GlgA [Thioclava sp. L04-15]OOY28370.1 starch synthase [Thioclava sp. L04-15]TNE91358.1 MAG: glycogen synthase GlgA [Paracoccaceae bacterium]
MKHVLSVASEAVPLVKTGGLADVVGALPAALAEQGWNMRVMIPAYRGILKKLKSPKKVWESANLYGGPARLTLGKSAGMEVLALVADHLFDRDGGPYSQDGQDYGDNAERFAALSFVAAEIAREGLGKWRPDLVHCHDWQTGLVPWYLRGSGIPTVITIHNIAFQGRFGRDKLAALGLQTWDFNRDGVEFWGDISTLKAGLVAADAITTVSPRYAEELMRGEFGLGLEGLLQMRAGDLHGILNGIDATVWNPETDPEITPFSAAKPAGKASNRKALEAEFGLDVPGPLAILISRLTSQKGIDLITPALGPFLAAGGGLAVLGSGDGWAEHAMRELAAHNPGRVGVKIGYDEALSHRMFAGGDAVLVPSRFEPCGLTQLYGLRYGCLPVVAAVGGLADTVIGATPATDAANASTGVVFHPVDDLALRQALMRFAALYYDRKGWGAMQRRAMKMDWGWARSAERYAALYDQLCTR